MRRGLWAALVAIPIMLACGATPVSIAKSPASAMTLNVYISDHDATSSNVQVRVDIMVAGYAGLVMLTSTHTLVCDGVKLNLTPYTTALVPRQPPGGAYMFVYTDEQRRPTTLVVPVPLRAFAITSPAEGAAVKLPRQPAQGLSPTLIGSGFTTGGADSASLDALEGTPVPSPKSTPPETPTPPGWLRYPSQVSQPPVLIRYTMPAIPADAIATFQATAYSGQYVATSVSTSVGGPPLPATGTYALTDVDLTPGFGFERFSPGAGQLLGQLTMNWPLVAGGFHAAHVTFDESATVDVTWTR